MSAPSEANDAAGCLDALIARIQTRIADPFQVIDDAMPTVRPPATLAELERAEAALGFPIPPLLRRLFLEVGNGGFGPVYGLVGVPTIPPTPFQADIVVLYARYSESSPDEKPSWRWPHGVVPLISCGCNIMECVDFLHPPYPLVLDDPNEYDWERPLAEQQKPIAASLANRLETWLNSPPPSPESADD